MDIPYRLAKSVLTHYSRIATHATCDGADHRTRDAFRLSRKEVAQLRQHIERYEQDIEPH